MIRSLRILVALAAILGCSQCVSQQEISKVEYQVASRTFRQQIIITPDSVSRVREDFRKDPTPVITRRVLSSHEWTRVMNALKGLKLNSINEMPSPTDRRTYDAASHGSITITQDSSSYTHGFDDADPHDKLKPLMEVILKLDE